MLNNVSISPNPFSSEINLKNVPANLTYSISDLSGKIVDSGLTQNKLSLAHLENGMYVLKIEGYEVKRIIKE